MNNQLFAPNPNNPMFSMFGGYNQFMQSFNAFAQQIQCDPSSSAADDELRPDEPAAV